MLVASAIAIFRRRDLRPDQYERRGRLFKQISEDAQDQEMMEEAERQMMMERDDGGILQAEDDSEADHDEEEEEEEYSCDEDDEASTHEEGTGDAEVAGADAADKEHQGSAEDKATEEGQHVQDNRTSRTAPVEKAGRGGRTDRGRGGGEGGRRGTYNPVQPLKPSSQPPQDILGQGLPAAPPRRVLFGMPPRVAPPGWVTPGTVAPRIVAPRIMAPRIVVHGIAAPEEGFGALASAWLLLDFHSVRG